MHIGIRKKKRQTKYCAFSQVCMYIYIYRSTCAKRHVERKVSLGAEALFSKNRRKPEKRLENREREGGAVGPDQNPGVYISFRKRLENLLNTIK